MYRFTRDCRVLKKADFCAAIFYRDRVFRQENYSCYIRKNSHEHARLGVSVSKKAGNAVIRNRYKRSIREFFRLNYLKMPQGFDYVFVIKPYKKPIDQSYFAQSDRFCELIKYFEKRNNYRKNKKSSS